jgi:hypothetical protein
VCVCFHLIIQSPYNGTRVKASNGSLDPFIVQFPWTNPQRANKSERERERMERQCSALRFPEIKRSMALWVIRGPRGLDGERDR